jgi:hypothetical protein
MLNNKTNYMQFSEFTGYEPSEYKEELKNFYTQRNLPMNNFFQRFIQVTDILPKQKTKQDKKEITYKSLDPIKTNPIKLDSPTTYSFPNLFTGNKTTKAKQIRDYFVTKGLSKEQASGIVGNLMAESSLNPTAFGDNNTSFGLAQWHKERFTNLKNFASKFKQDHNAIGTQLEYLWHELNTSEKSALDALKQAKDPESAAKIFAHKFERMKTYNKKREHYAKNAYSL